MFHKDKPIDWLLDHILWVKVCNPEKDLVSLNIMFTLFFVCYLFICEIDIRHFIVYCYNSLHIETLQ